MFSRVYEKLGLKSAEIELPKLPAWNENEIFSSIDWERCWEVAKSTYKNHLSIMHGEWHWKNVERNTLLLTNTVPDADPVVARLFAIFHDTMREDDGRDLDHGLRSSQLVKTLNGSCFKISEQKIEKLVIACRDHNKKKVTSDPTIGVCWDADRLDLIRINIRPKAEYMSTEEGKRLAAKVL